MTQLVKTDTVPVSRNLLLQIIAYLEQHQDPMAKMLIQQSRFCLCQEDSEPTRAPEETYEEV